VRRQKPPTQPSGNKSATATIQLPCTHTEKYKNISKKTKSFSKTLYRLNKNYTHSFPKQKNKVWVNKSKQNHNRGISTLPVCSQHKALSTQFPKQKKHTHSVNLHPHNHPKEVHKKPKLKQAFSLLTQTIRKNLSSFPQSLLLSLIYIYKYLT